MRASKFGWLLSGALCALGCSSAEESQTPHIAVMTGGDTASPTGGALLPSGGVLVPTGGVVTGGIPMTTGGLPPAGTGGVDATGGLATGGVDATGGMDMTGGMMATGGNTNPPGPEDGDPNAPVVAIPEVTCGGSAGGFGLGQPNHQIDGRDMIVTYPCGKHEGAPMTFVLNLHGTTPVNLHFYQHGYFPIHNYAASHNLIVVTPSSVVEQWGNGDNGQDEPHLLKIIDWVYSAFSKYDIRGMWVAGHSWGGMYTARFGCSAAIADKVVGLFMQSGGGVTGFSAAACADRVSVLISTAEGDGREPSDQSALAASHGCDPAVTEMLLNNKYTYWPNCDPGYSHANYYMLGKEHATAMDAEVAESAADWIKAARQ